jgi:hypothetical protein
MSLDCVIKVGEKIRPVKDFLHNDDHYYSAVKNHLKRCEVCSPKEALEGFLLSRSKTYGQTSSTLCRMAGSYERIFPGKIPKYLIDEFFIRGMMNWELFAEHIKVLTEADVIRAHSLIIESQRMLIKGSILPKLEEAIKNKDERGASKYLGDFRLHSFHHLQRRVDRFCSGNFDRRPQWRIRSWMYDDPRFKLAVSLIEGSSDEVSPDEKDPDIIKFSNLRKVYLVMRS